MLKNLKTFDWKRAVESTLGGIEAKIDSALKGDGNDSPSTLQGQIKAYQELLVDAQFSQLVLFREQQALFAEKDREIEKLKVTIEGSGIGPVSSVASDSEESGDCDGSDAENQGELSNSERLSRQSSSKCTAWMVEWEKQMKANIMDKIEALAQAREREETVRDLSRQLEALKEMLRAQDRKLERSERLDTLIRQAEREGSSAEEMQGTAQEALGIEFARLSKQFELQRQELSDTLWKKAALEEEIERQTTHIDMLMAGAAPVSPSSPSVDGVFSDKDAELTRVMSECARLKRDLAEERKRNVELSSSFALCAGSKQKSSGTNDEEKKIIERLQAESVEKDAKVRSLETSRKELEERSAQIKKDFERKSSQLVTANALAASVADEHVNALEALGAKHQDVLQSIQVEHQANVASLSEQHADAIKVLDEQLQAARAKEKESRALVDSGKEREAALEGQVESTEALLQDARAELDKATEEHQAAAHALEVERDDALVAMAESAAEATQVLEAEKAAAADALRAEEARAAAAQKAAVEAMRESMQAQVDENRRLYLKESTLRKRVHNELMDLKGNIRVYCRVRPVLEFEKKNNGAEMAADVTEFPVSNEIILARDAASSNRFEFDSVFHPDTTQSEVFEDISPLITSVLDGYNVCIFAYGQTGSGKTYTMEGSGSDPGVNFRALEALFTIREDRKADEAYDFSVSVLEIYNENVRDLLTKLDKPSAAKSSLDLRLGTDGKVFVQGLEKVAVDKMSDVKSAMRRAQSNRAVGAHNMNEHSSRSHLVLTIYVSAVNKVSGNKSSGSLNLIDLAGSERVGKTDATGDRLKEAQAINKSLSALGDVISALGQHKPGTHVPFRNSKLTHLLQNSMGGDSKVAMFVNISPIKWNVNESITSLQFAHRCRKVELGAAKKSGDSKELAKYKQMVDDLKAQLGSQSRNYQSTPAKPRK